MNYNIRYLRLPRSSVRILNELGAGHPRATKIMCAHRYCNIAFDWSNVYVYHLAVLFTNSEVVMKTVSTMAILLGVSDTLWKLWKHRVLLCYWSIPGSYYGLYKFDEGCSSQGC